MHTDIPAGPLPEIQLQPVSYTVGHWVLMVPRGHYELSAPYQRGSVWGLAQKRALVKSLYMHLPIGSVVVSKLRGGAAYRVVDGKQRIEAIVAFSQDEFSVPASWFRPGDLKAEAATKAEVTWSDLADGARTSFEVTVHFPALEFSGQTEIWFDKDGKRHTRQRSDEEVLAAEAEIFDLINFAGTPQTDEDRERARQVAAHPEEHL